MTVIMNANSIPINQNSGTLPNMFGALQDWFQPMTFGFITKTVSDFQVIESVENITFMGVWQPLGGRQLKMKPEGQRQWSSYMLHSDITLELKIDDIVTYLGVQYRVLANKNYELYKFRYYELCQDWTGSGPPTP